MKTAVASLIILVLASACQTTAERELSPITQGQARLDVSETGIDISNHSVKADDGPTIYRERHIIGNSSVLFVANLNFVSANRSGWKLGPGLMAEHESAYEEIGFSDFGNPRTTDLSYGKMQYAPATYEGDRCNVFAALYSPIGPFYRGYINGALCDKKGSLDEDAFVEVMDSIEVSLF